MRPPEGGRLAERSSRCREHLPPAGGITAAEEEAVRRAEARMAEKMSDEEAALVQAALVHATTQLKVKRQHRK